jgi:hypothetical protein
MSLLVNARDLRWMNHELSELRWGRAIYEKLSHCMGLLEQFHTVRVNSHSRKNANPTPRIYLGSEFKL